MMNRIPQARMALDSSLVRMSALALLAAAAIHAAAARFHFDEDVLHGSLFVAAAVAQTLAGLSLLVTASRRLLLCSAVLSAGVVAAWVVSRTVGLPGSEVSAEREVIGVADAIATGLELFVVSTALAVVSLPRSLAGARLSLPVAAWLSVISVGIVALTVPAVSAAPRHEHADGHAD